jgi:hypothetical protein
MEQVSDITQGGSSTFNTPLLYSIAKNTRRWAETYLWNHFDRGHMRIRVTGEELAVLMKALRAREDALRSSISTFTGELRGNNISQLDRKLNLDMRAEDIKEFPTVVKLRRQLARANTPKYRASKARGGQARAKSLT